ncbi:Argininosuccinate synthase - like 1 [Theobroma cacao]|nr:Argininosuccinate synthase - like 1 [Theobroma cacao]
MAQLKALSPNSSINLACYGPRRNTLLFSDSLSCSRKLSSFLEVSGRASALHGRAILSNNGSVTLAASNRGIRAVLSSDREMEVSTATKAGGLRGKLNKVVLAYSGGLDTSVIVPWLRENYGCEVVCFTADVGQGIKELDGLEEKAKASGACQLVVKDLKEEFVRDYIFPCLRAGAIYERKYLLGTSMARPVIAKAMVDVAREVGADAVSHGCTGKGNDQACHSTKI